MEQFPDKINCVTLHLVGYILEYETSDLVNMCAVGAELFHADSQE
jgi:hypothetical protein